MMTAIDRELEEGRNGHEVESHVVHRSAKVISLVSHAYRQGHVTREMHTFQHSANAQEEKKHE